MLESSTIHTTSHLCVSICNDFFPFHFILIYNSYAGEQSKHAIGAKREGKVKREGNQAEVFRGKKMQRTTVRASLEYQKSVFDFSSPLARSFVISRDEKKNLNFRVDGKISVALEEVQVVPTRLFISIPNMWYSLYEINLFTFLQKSTATFLIAVEAFHQRQRVNGEIK